MEDTLNSIYYNPKHHGSFGGVNKLYSAAHKVNKQIKRRDIIKYLKKQDSYTLHKPVRRRYPTSKTVAYSIDHIWQADIADMQRLAEYNERYRYILFVIDVHSRFLFLKPLYSKNTKEVSEAFYKIMHENMRYPGLLHTDQGSEFIGSIFQNMLKSFNIGFYFTNSPHKASLVERVQRTIKERMYRYFTKFSTYKYIDVLSHFQEAYNTSIHRMIGITPVDAQSKEGTIPKSHTKAPKYDVGVHVRISGVKSFINKGYMQGWSDEIFTIFKVKRNVFPEPMFILRDQLGEILSGAFYSHEIQPVDYNPDGEYKIDKIIHEKGRGRNKMFYVKWKGWPEKFNSYIKASAVKNKLL